MNKGYSSSRKANGSEVAFPTVEPIREEQHGLSVLAHVFTREVGLDAAEAGSGVGLIVATGHAALKGDVIRMTSGASAEKESKVVRVEADNIYLADEVAVSDTDAFQILRHKYAVVDDDGNLQVAVAPSPIFYERDGLDQVVVEDTGTPASNRPLPVKVFDFAGAEVDFATEAKQDTGNASLAAIEAIDFALEATQADIKTAVEAIAAEDFATEATLSDVKAAVESIAAEDFATQTTLAALLTELQLKADLTETQPISAASLPLPTGASTEATLAALLAELELKANLTDTQPVSGPLTDTQLRASAVPVSAAALPLPSGAATEATLAAASGKLPATLGQKTKANSLAVVLASDSDVLSVSNPGNGYADSARKASGSVTSGAWVELIASTAAAAKGLCLFDSSGVSLELGIGAAASETRKLIVPPGGLNGFIPLAIPAGSRVSVRALGTTADYTSSELLLTLLG